jgi:hypothetical protein
MPQRRQLSLQIKLRSVDVGEVVEVLVEQRLTLLPQQLLQSKKHPKCK